MPVRVLLFLCPNITTLVSDELPLKCFSALAEAHLPHLHSVQLNTMFYNNTSIDGDHFKMGYGKLKKALKQIEKKYLGVQWEVGTIIVVSEAPVSTLYDFKGMVVSGCEESGFLHPY
jgi:hypothetical protein